MEFKNIKDRDYSLEIIKRQTSSLLDADEAKEFVANMTQESIDEMKSAKYKDEEESSLDCAYYYGHDMRYDGWDYLFRAGDGCPGNGCGMTWWRLDRRYWNHEFRSRRCGNHNNLAELKFTRR